MSRNSFGFGLCNRFDDEKATRAVETFGVLPAAIVMADIFVPMLWGGRVHINENGSVC